MDSESWRAVFDELVCAMNRAAEAFSKSSLSETDREAIAAKIEALANLIAEVATIGRLPFDTARGAQIREKVKEIEKVIDALIEKAEAL